MRARKTLVAAGLGLGYGAVLGALVGAALALSLWVFPNVRRNALDDSVVGALWGFCLGGSGGCDFGLAGSRARGPAGWGLAGALGGLVAGISSQWVGLWLASPLGWFVGIPGVLFEIQRWFPLLPIAAGALVGVGFGRGIERRRSPLPGVGRLAAVVAEADGPVEAAPGMREVSPAGCPEGRGDEASAAG